MARILMKVFNKTPNFVETQSLTEKLPNQICQTIGNSVAKLIG